VATGAVARELGRALKYAAGAWPILVNAAAIILAEKLASTVDVRQHALTDDSRVTLKRNVDGKRRELPHLVAAENRGVVMSILLAACGGTPAAGTVTDNCNPHA
jgi:hypothetical protein